MTTIKEYEAMMEGTTDAPWSISHRADTAVSANNGRGICSTGGYADNTKDPDVLYKENKSNADFIAASRNIAPELIRVIELAEDGLMNAQATLRHHGLYDLDKVERALSEIRKLRGE